MRGFINTCTSAALCALLAADTAPNDAGEPVPALVLEKVDGTGRATLASYCGRVVALELWASDCRACEPSLAALDALERQWPRSDFATFGVNVDDDAATARAFLAAHLFDTPMFWDADRRAVDALKIRGVPTAVLIDRQGRIRARIEGYSDAKRAELLALVRALAAQSRPQSC